MRIPSWIKHGSTLSFSTNSTHQWQKQTCDDLYYACCLSWTWSRPTRRYRQHLSKNDLRKEEKELKVLEEELKETQKGCSEISKKLDEFQVVSHLLRDGGIKSQIIKKYVPIFNKLINKYLNNMDFFVNFTLDEEFNETLKSRFRDEFTYSSFSEGEKQKIDLALLFTWREVARMKNSVATNLLILDEVFDSSLDAGATAELLQILRALGQTTNLFVISHKGDILVDKFLRTIKFEKINDFSKMSDDS